MKPRALLTLTLMLCLPATLPAQDTPGRFYDRDAEGWFWYAEEPPEPEPEPEVPPIPPAPEPPPPVAEPVAEAAPAPAGPPPLSAAWLRENLDHFRDAALDDPSPRNVALYMYLQRVVMDKAERFSQASQRAVLGDPFLDEVTQRPLATFAANMVNRQAAAARDMVLARIAREAGIWFFYRSDCHYCEAQAPLLQTLSRRYGFRVQAISLDGRPMPSGLYPDYIVDRGQSRALDIYSTPALYLVRPPKDVVPLSQGVLSIAQLQERIVAAASRAGWIDEADLDRTRPRIVDLHLDPSAIDAGTLTEQPDQLLELLRARARAQSMP